MKLSVLPLASLVCLTGCHSLQTQEQATNVQTHLKSNIFEIRSALDPDSPTYLRLKLREGYVSWLGSDGIHGRQMPVPVRSCVESADYFCGNIFHLDQRFAVPKVISEPSWEFDGLRYKIWNPAEEFGCVEDVLVHIYKREELYAFLRYNRSFGVKELSLISDISIDEDDTDTYKYLVFTDSYIVRPAGLWADHVCEATSN